MLWGYLVHWRPTCLMLRSHYLVLEVFFLSKHSNGATKAANVRLTWSAGFLPGMVCLPPKYWWAFLSEENGNMTHRQSLRNVKCMHRCIGYVSWLADMFTLRLLLYIGCLAVSNKLSYKLNWQELGAWISFICKACRQSRWFRWTSTVRLVSANPSLWETCICSSKKYCNDNLKPGDR